MIKKKLDNDINVELTRLDLNIVEDPSVENQIIFNYCLDHINKLENNMEFLKQDSQRLSNERSEALKVSFAFIIIIIINNLFKKEFEKCVNEKIKIETDLYSKVIAVLRNKMK